MGFRGELEAGITGKSSQNCTFCAPDQVQRPHFAEYGMGRLDLIRLVETDNLIVIPDILPVDIHLLMIPKPHKYSFAALPELADEIGWALHRSEEIVGIPLTIVEHGAVADGGSLQSIYHQHSHLIGANGFDLVRYMSEILTQHGIHHQCVITPDRSPVNNLQRLFQNQGYFYLQQGKRGIMAHDPNDAFPSQIAQRNIGRLFSRKELDWKRIPDDPEVARESVSRVVRLLDRCKL